MTTLVEQSGLVSIRPTYLELAEGLAADFRAVGDRVPSENEIATSQGVSRPTARAALQELERRFLVRRIRGAGTFVSRRIDYVISDRRPPSASATLRAAGANPVTELVEARSQPCPADVARHLGIERGARVLVVRRLIRLDDVVTSWTSAYLPATLVPGLAAELATKQSLFEVLRDVYGIRAHRRWSRASLDLPPMNAVRALRLEGTPPSWLIEGVNETRGRPAQAIEFTRSWMRADLVNVVFEMGQPPRTVATQAEMVATQAPR